MVKCSDGSIYTGATSDICRRLRQHNGEISGGAKYTASRRPVILSGALLCQNRSEALRIECLLKRLKKHEKISWCEVNKIEKTR